MPPKKSKKKSNNVPEAPIEHVDNIAAQVLFRGRHNAALNAGDVPITPEKVLMNSSDMKALGVRTGTWVLVSMQGGAVRQLLMVWPNKDTRASTCVIHRMWTKSVEGLVGSISSAHATSGHMTRSVTRQAKLAHEAQTRNVVISRPTLRPLLQPCPSVHIKIASSSSREGADDGLSARVELLESEVVQFFVKSHLINVPLLARPSSSSSSEVLLQEGVSSRYVSDTTVNIVWQGQTISLAVSPQIDSSQILPTREEESSSSSGGGSDSEKGTRDAWWTVTMSTQISTHVTPTNNDNGISSNNTKSSGGSSDSRRLAGTSSLIDMTDAGFGGYVDQRATAIRLLESARGPSSNITPPCGILIQGPHGSGKSTFARWLQSVSGCAAVWLDAGMLVTDADGGPERHLQASFQRAMELASGGLALLVLDDCDKIFVPRQDASDLQRRLVTALLSLMDGVGPSSGNNASTSPRMMVVGTCVSSLDLDAALRRPGRFDVELEVGVPSRDDRRAILATLADRVCPGLDKGMLEKVAALGHGMVGSDLEVVLKTAIQVAADEWEKNKEKDNEGKNDFRDMGGEDGLEDAMQGLSLATPDAGTVNIKNINEILTPEILTLALKSVTPSGLREVAIEVPQVRWGDIGGMEDAKTLLREVVEWPLKHATFFRQMHIRPPRGVMLYGPPGCSKTLMAKALATESEMNFLAVRGPELMSKYLGESEKAVQALFRRARAAAPSIVFFDEIDALAGVRGTSDSGVSDRVLSQLLTELDGSGVVDGVGPSVIIVIATNRPDMLDPALTRPGRIDRKIYVGPPDDHSRQQILNMHLGLQPCAPDVLTQTGLSELVACTRGLSGAEMVAVCQEATLTAQEEGAPYLTMAHLHSARATVIPQITSSMLDYYRNMQEQCAP